MHDKKSFNAMADDAISIFHHFDEPYVLTTKQIKKISERKNFHKEFILDGFCEAMLKKGYLVTALLEKNQYHVNSLECMADDGGIAEKVFKDIILKIAKEKKLKARTGKNPT